MKIQTLLCLSLTFVVSFTARADEPLSAAARKIFTEKQDSVVWVSAVAKTSFSSDSAKDSPVNMPDQESKMEGLGTIVDPAGLVVTSLSQLDPSRTMSGRRVRTSQGPVTVEAVSTLKEVKVIMPDGTEIPAEVVMKDTDLDLAFVRVKAASKEAKGVTFQAIDLKNSAPGKILDDTVTITRMEEVLDRAANVTPGHINMVTKKPRVFLRASGGMGGCPTFLSDGKLLGICAARLVKNKTPVAVIIPAADVLEIAEQAKNAKPVEEKEAPAKEGETQEKAK